MNYTSIICPFCGKSLDNDAMNLYTKITQLAGQWVCYYCNHAFVLDHIKKVGI